MKQIFLAVILIILTLPGRAGSPLEDGKTLFTSRCMNCHKINEVFVGPSLAGVDKRRSMDWIVKFVQSSQTMVKSGDKDAMELFAKFKVPMPDQMDLKAADIENIVEFIKIESSIAAAAPKAPFAKPVKLQSSYLPVSSADTGFFIAFFITVALLVGTLMFYVKVKQFEQTKVW